MATRTIHLQAIRRLSPSQLHATMATAPGLTPVARQVVTGLSPAALHTMVQAAAQVGESIPQAAAEASADASLAALGNAVATLVGAGIFAKWGDSLNVNPISNIARRRDRPVKFLVSNITLSAAGAGTFSWAPQEQFEGYRVCVPSGQGAGFINQLVAGDRLMLTQVNRVPFNVLRENSDCGKIDLPLVKLGETISAQVTGGTANAEVTGVIIGFGERKRVLPDGATVAYERWHPFDVTSVGGSTTATINLQPQRNEILRRIVFDDSTANFANLFVTSITVQDMPQQIGPNAEVLAQLFGELAQDDWMDFDLCQLGGIISIGLRNSNANAVNAQGMALVDVVNLENDPKR